MFTSSWRLLAVFLPHKQVVELKQEQLLYFFLQLSGFIFILPVSMLQDNALLRFFPGMHSHISLCCLEISAASLVHSVLF